MPDKVCGECAEWTPGDDEIGTCSNVPHEEVKESWPRAYNHAGAPACDENFKERKSDAERD